MEHKASPAKVRVEGIVRNRHGQPQFDDFNNIPEIFHPFLTEEDWKYIETNRTD